MVDNSRGIIRHSRHELLADSRSGLDRRAWVTPQPYQPQQLSLGELWRTVARRRVSILVFAGIVFALAVAYVFLKTPMYEGVARLQIDPMHPTTLGLDDDKERLASPADVESRLKTEVTIIQSDTVAMQVMKALQLHADPHFASEEIIQTAVKDPYDLPPKMRRKLLEKFKDNLTVKTLPATQVVEIRFRSTDATLATNVANSIIDEYLQRNLSARVEGTAQVSQWVSKQMQEVRANTTAAQEKLAQFQKDNNMLGADESDNIVTDRLKQLNEELTQAEADRIVKEGRYRLANSGNAELIGSLVPSTTLQVLRTQEADLRTQRAQLGAKFGSGYPKLHELDVEIAHVEEAIKGEGGNIKTRLANEYDTASKAENMIRNDFERQKSEAFQLNEHVAQYAILKHEVEAGQQLYDTLQLKLKAAGITSGLSSSFVDVIDRAQIPDKPVEPRKALYLALGLTGGLFGGLMLGLVRDSFDDSVASSEQLEKVMGLPELVSVPFLSGLRSKERQDKKRLASRSVFNPIAVKDPNSPGVESFRALCSTIMLASDRNAIKTIVVTSAMPGEGKSTVSCNLATALAQRGRRVLLVDADLRCSSIYPQLGVRPGLSTMCAAGATNHPRYQPLANLPGLHVVPAGIRPTDPTAVLDSTGMQELMTTWREEYDHVIIDTPPALPFADALVLGARADGVILVARAGWSRTGAQVRAREVLARSGANLLGFVLNAVRDREYYYEYPDSYKLPETDAKTVISY